MTGLLFCCLQVAFFWGPEPMTYWPRPMMEFIGTSVEGWIFSGEMYLADVAPFVIGSMEGQGRMKILTTTPKASC